MADWELRHLMATAPGSPDRPAEVAYSAAVALLREPFLRLTQREREKQVHLGAPCRSCDLCQSIALRHAQWATDKLRKHLNGSPPITNGEQVRDWITIMEWVADPARNRVLIADVRAGLCDRLAPDHWLLPLVLAIRTQLLPALHDRSPRRMRDFVGDFRRGVVALQQDWVVKPDRDFRHAKRFAPLWVRHPRGCAVLVDVLKRLDNGDPDAFRSALTNPDAQPDDAMALRALIGELLDAPATRDWYLRNVDAREGYYQDLKRRRYSGVESLPDIGDDGC